MRMTLSDGSKMRSPWQKSAGPLPMAPRPGPKRRTPMSERTQCTFEAADALHVVVSKLSTISDFMQIFDDNFTLRKSTPEGITIIIGECIEILKKIGGGHAQPEK
jgi:hypothetical protein